MFRRFLKRTSLFWMTGISLLVALLGFIFFSGLAGDSKASEQLHADAIVVFTGENYRIQTGLRLLKAGSGQKLLISGVHPNTTKASLKRRYSEFASQIDCCVDLDYEALDTIGNAREAAEWMSWNDYNSMILVTAGYHMPRAKLLMGRASSELDITPFPVQSAKYDKWWENQDTTQRMASEYLKYLASMMMIEQLDGPKPPMPVRRATVGQ